MIHRKIEKHTIPLDKCGQRWEPVTAFESHVVVPLAALGHWGGGGAVSCVTLTPHPPPLQCQGRVPLQVGIHAQAGPAAWLLSGDGECHVHFPYLCLKDRGETRTSLGLSTS